MSATWKDAEYMPPFLMRANGSLGFATPPSNYAGVDEMDPQIICPSEWLTEARAIRHYEMAPTQHECWTLGQLQYGMFGRTFSSLGENGISRFEDAVRRELTRDATRMVELRVNHAVTRLRACIRAARVHAAQPAPAVSAPPPDINPPSSAAGVSDAASGEDSSGSFTCDLEAPLLPPTRLNPNWRSAHLEGSWDLSQLPGSAPIVERGSRSDSEIAYAGSDSDDGPRPAPSYEPSAETLAEIRAEEEREEARQIRRAAKRVEREAKRVGSAIEKRREQSRSRERPRESRDQACTIPELESLITEVGAARARLETNNRRSSPSNKNLDLSTGKMEVDLAPCSSQTPRAILRSPQPTTSGKKVSFSPVVSDNRGNETAVKTGPGLTAKELKAKTRAARKKKSQANPLDASS